MPTPREVIEAFEKSPYNRKPLVQTSAAWLVQRELQTTYEQSELFEELLQEVETVPELPILYPRMPGH